MPFLKFIDRCEKEDIMASTANGVTVLTELHGSGSQDLGISGTSKNVDLE